MLKKKNKTNNQYILKEHSAGRFKDPPPEIKYLVDGLIPLNVAGTLYSPGGMGKSTLAIDLCLRIAIAEEFKTKWLGQFPINEGGRIVYLSAEDPENILHHRIFELTSQLAIELGVEKKDLDILVEKNFSIINTLGNLSTLFTRESNHVIKATDEYDKIKNTITTEINIRLIVIDPKSRFSGLDENDNSIVAQEVKHYEQFSRLANANLLILHHNNKGSSTNSNIYSSYRGASAFLDCLRFGLHLYRPSNETLRNNNIEIDPSSEYLFLETTKQNYCKQNGKIRIRREGFKFTAIQSALVDSKIKQLEFISE